jgi:phosphoglucosamine mutase
MVAERKYFGTDGIRGRVGQSLINPEFVLKLGWAAGMVLNQSQHGKVLIGKDTRISGYMLESALEAGLSAAGVNIHLLGPMPTPAIAYLTRTFRAQAGIVISASHNPYDDNGIKFFSIQGTKISSELELAIEEQLDSPMTIVDPSKLGKAVRVVDAAGRYIEFCKSIVPHGLSLAGLKIVVDCAQGATYHVAPKVLRELGAKVIDIGTDPTGLNINEDCGSTKPDLLQKQVLLHSADLGIALDGDGDRVIMIDQTGEVVDGDELLFIMARYYQQKSLLKGGIVGTVMTNFGFEQALKNLNIPFVRTKVGDRYVMEELKKQGWLLGGESSGHIVNLGLTTTGDGIVSALQVLTVMCESGLSLRDLKTGLQKCPQTLINVAVSQLQKMEQIDQNTIIKDAVEKIEKHLQGRGRVLLRPSGTEPVVRVMVEGNDPEEVKNLAKELAGIVEKHLE